MHRFSTTIFFLIFGLFLSCNKSNLNSSKKLSKPEWASKKFVYNPSKTLLFDLIHTKLDVRFNWEKRQLIGLATITAKPYFYPQDTLTLDAKSFEIESVKLKFGEKYINLNYRYSDPKLAIYLNKFFQAADTFTLEIAYTANPEKRATTGSEAITSDKGLYFINHDGADKLKPRQIWTQGETESSSCWFPTIEATNDRMSQETYITVEDNFKTLSNGTLVYSKQNENGKRTDYWKQDKPHTPYLFMIAVGEFAKVEDSWREMEVSYYVENSYARYAKSIFGNTPEMLEFFSNKLGYNYPWDKYSQIVVRDYVSGAMENTSAAVFMEALQIDNREKLDKNWDFIIAHELFHHWFGDLVTCESWANLPLNESFANYSEYLWEEYKNGVDAADYHLQNELDEYLGESLSKQEPLIRYYYGDKEEMFDSHSYSKGGCILHMLRMYVGDEAFFKSLSYYLHQNAYKPVEIHHLRLAFEHVTGEDLNWFFNQYFLSAGHANLAVEQQFEAGKVKLSVIQMQDSVYTPIYKIPVKVDVWVNGIKTQHKIVVEKAFQQFEFSVASKPNLVLFDADQQIVGTIKSDKSVEELKFQYYNAKKYAARFEAITKLMKYVKTDSLVVNVMLDATKDNFWYLRELAALSISSLKDKNKLIETRLKEMANEEPKPRTRARVINLCSENRDSTLVDIYKKAMNDSAYSVVSAGLSGYLKLEPKDSKKILSQYESLDNKEITSTLAEYYAEKSDSSKYDWFINKLNKNNGTELYYLLTDFTKYLKKMPTSLQLAGFKVVEPIARNNFYYWVRFSAFKLLNEFKDLPNAKEVIESIKKSETNPKLVERYSKM